MAIADKTDEQIVALLRENARRSYQDIGERVSLSAPAVKRRVDRLEAEGVIRGYTATVEPTAFGWHSHAFVELFCEGRMSGAASAILHLRATDTQHLEEALERIRETSGVLRTETQVVLSTLFERPVTNGRVTPKGRR